MWSSCNVLYWVLIIECSLMSVEDCLAPVPAEFVALLHGITRRSKGRGKKVEILLGFLSKVNCMHTLGSANATRY